MRPNYNWFLSAAELPFLLFLSSSALLCIYVFAISALYIKVLMDGEYPIVWKAMKKYPAAIVPMIYYFISLLFAGGLTSFHLYLIGTNQEWKVSEPRTPRYCRSPSYVRRNAIRDQRRSRS